MGDPRQGNDTPALARVRILVVEDDLIVQAVLERILQRGGFDVVFSASVDEALRCLAADPEIRVTTVDQGLPGTPGLVLVEAIRTLYPRVRVVVISGTELPADCAAQPDRFFRKPFQGPELLAALRELVAS